MAASPQNDDCAMTDAVPQTGDAAALLDDPILRDVYLPLAEIPLISAASFVNGRSAVSVTLSTRDHSANTWLKTRFELALHQKPSNLFGTVERAEDRVPRSWDDSLDDAPANQDGGDFLSHPVTVTNAGSTVAPVPASDDTIKASWVSPEELTSPLKVILRESSVASTSLKEGNGKRRTVEIWRGHRCAHRIDVSKKHGSFATDDTFGTLDVNNVEGHLRVLYSAEANLEAWEEPDDNLAPYEYRPAFGEKLQARIRTTLFLLDVPTKTVSELKLKSGPDVDGGPVAAKSVLSFEGNSVYATILTLTGDGRRPGQVYCTNRPSAIHELRLPSPTSADGSKWEVELTAESRLSPLGWSANSPYAIHNSAVFLCVREGGAHNNACSVLRANRKRCEVLIPEPKAEGKDKKMWQGLFAQGFPTFALLNCKPRKYLIITSLRAARRTPFVIDLNGGWTESAFTDLSPTQPTMHMCAPRRLVQADHAKTRALLERKDSEWSYNVLNTNMQTEFLAVRSRPNVPHQLVLGTVFEFASQLKVLWSVLWRADEGYADPSAETADLFRQLGAVSSSIINIEKAAEGVQSIVVRPPLDEQEKEKAEVPPFILFPHGGPHSASTIDWNPSVAALAVLGYTVALPNYSGSVGISPAFVNSLLGKCGTLDVADCTATTDQLVEQGVAARGRLFITGGSHGGFLTAHLVGRTADCYRAAVMRNPVIAVGQQAVTSDIEDWCYAEFGEPFNFAHPPTLRPDVFKRLEDQSPIAHMHKIEAPVLLLIGLKDLRVPYWSQGRVLYHSLKAQKKPVRMLTFKDADHALDTLEAESISLLSTVRWFRAALEK
ncbi:hypothetical protein OC844_002122 [Tilletia horrida]|nr:hypothetical protein OC844_002122 [Tilletia horrida]